MELAAWWRGAARVLIILLKAAVENELWGGGNCFGRCAWLFVPHPHRTSSGLVSEAGVSHFRGRPYSNIPEKKLASEVI